MAKNGKKSHKVLWVIIILLVLAMFGSCGSNDDESTDTSNDVEVEEEVEYPEFIESGYDKAIYDVVENGKTGLLDLSKDDMYIASVYCPNREDDVNELLDNLAPVVIDNSDGEDLAVVVYKELNTDSTVLANCLVHPDGTHEITSHHDDFKTAHKIWRDGLVNGWDGSCRELNDLIKDYMNDPDSFEHDETSFVDIRDDEALAAMQDVFNEHGYTTDLQVGDVVITTKFRGTNAFGGVVTNQAIGVAHYETGIVELIDMG